MNPPPALDTQCLVLGAGVAGLATAIAAARRGVRVTVVSCASPETAESNSAWAQGGIIYGVSAPELLRNDIFRAGAFANYPAAVDQLVERGPEAVRELLLESEAVPFERDDQGSLRYAQEGGHSTPRVLFRGDETGSHIQRALYRTARTLPTVRFLPGYVAVNLLMTPKHALDAGLRNGPSRCFGAFLFRESDGAVVPVTSEHTVIATGGVGQLFLSSTNNRFARGDGLALAHRAGARLEALEYVQFHPTVFWHPSGRRFLVSEAVRGEGAVVVNAAGERFLARYMPDESVPELAPRDRVARAIHEEMLRTGTACVYLDIRGRSAEELERRFPSLYRNCRASGVAIEKDLIPIAPAAHYHCGGVWSDLAGKTSVDGLWAAGEAACTGLHGANRLASTSLLEGLVWGSSAGAAIAQTTETRPFPAAEVPYEPWRHGTEPVDDATVEQDWWLLRHTMWNYVGLRKSATRLERALGILDELQRGIDHFYRRARLTPSLVGLRHGVLAARLITEASARNGRSLGCFQREDEG
jgi:L-aspartate oxidase